MHQAGHEYTVIFYFCTYSREIIDVFPVLTDFIVGLFTDTVEARFLKVCIIITLLGVYQFMSGLMTLTLFQGHRYVRIITIIIFNFALECESPECLRFLFFDWYRTQSTSEKLVIAAVAETILLPFPSSFHPVEI